MTRLTRRAALTGAAVFCAASGHARPLFVRGGAGAGGSETGTIPAITEIAPDRIFQRVGTSKTITFAGTYTGNPSSIQVQITDANTAAVIQAWTTLESQSIAGGNWSGTLSVPQGGWFKWQARFTLNTGVTGPISTNKFGVGMLIACLGQSNMSNMWTVNDGGFTPDAKTRKYLGSGWQTVGSAPMILWGNALRTKAVAAGADIPIGFLEYAIPGTAIESWLTVANGGSATSWNPFISSSTGVNAPDCGGDFEQVVWYQGESDANAAMSKSTYMARLDTLKSQLLAQTGRNTSTLRMGIALLATLGTYVAANVQAIREAQLEWSATNAPFSYLGLVSYDCIHGATDSTHFPNAQMQRFGRRWALGVAKSVGWSAVGADGPKIASISASGGSSTITLAVTQAGGTALLDGTGSSAGIGLAGIEIQYNGVNQTIVATAFSSGNIVLTMAAAPSSGNTVGVRYGYGNNPWGWVFDGTDTDGHIIYDNQSALIGDTTGFPLQPTNGFITTTA
jgi:hypothetical protein